MRKVIERFYSIIFGDREAPSDSVPYANKVFMFYFTMIVSVVVLFLIVQDILKNVEKLNAPTG